MHPAVAMYKPTRAASLSLTNLMNDSGKKDLIAK
jgi:hypothetical protein